VDIWIKKSGLKFIHSKVFSSDQLKNSIHNLKKSIISMVYFIDLNISVPFITIYKLLLAQGDKVSVLNRQLSLNVSGHTKRPAGTTGTLNKRPQNNFTF